MPTKAERQADLPAGLVPLLTQAQLETYYNVSDWTVRQWEKVGMPVEYLASTGKARYVCRRYDLEKVRAWHADRSSAAR